MARHLAFELPVELYLGATEEYVARITGTFTLGRPAYTPRGEYAPIDPPEDPEFEIETVEISRVGSTQWHPFPLDLLGDEQMAEIYQASCAHAAETDGPDPDAAYDAKRDEAMAGE